MKNITRILSLCLTAVCLLSSCTAGKGAERTQEQTQTVVKEKATGVYRRTEVVLPEGYEPDYDSPLSYINGEFHFTARYDHLYDGVSDFTADINGMVSEQGKNTSEAEPVHEDHFVHGSWKSPDGKTVFAEAGYNADGFTIKSVYLSCRDADGNVVYSVDLPGYLGYAITPETTYADVIGFCVKDCLFMDGTCLVLTNQGLCAVAENGMKLWSNTSQRAHLGIMDTALGVMYLSETGGLRIVNMADGSLSDKIPLPEEVSQGSQYQHFSEVYAGDGYDIYVKNKTGLYGVTFGTDEEGNTVSTSTEIINWINSNIVQDDINSLCIADENLILANMRNSYDRNEGNKLYLLKKVPDGEVQEKEVISLVQVGYNLYLGHAVMLFNEASETHRVVVTDYTVYDDADERKQKLNTEMAAGHVPDIIFYGDAYNTDTTLQDYISSGLFTDLTPLMRADETFDYDDLLGYVTKPHISADGAQYLFPLDPSAIVYLSSTDVLDGVMTTDEMFNMLETLPEGTGLTARDSSFFRDVLSYAVNERIDWVNYTCSFDDGEFAELIDRVKKQMDDPVKLPDYRYRLDYIGGYLKGEYLLYSTSARGSGGTSQFSTWAENRYYFGGDFVLTGVPNAEGKMVSAGAPSRYLAITEASLYKEEAFDLLETIMTVIRDIGEGGFFFGADVDNAYEKQADLTHTFKEHAIGCVADGEAAERVASGDADGVYKFTKEDAEYVKSVLNSIEDCLHTDNDAYEIAWEEIWNGDDKRTGAEIADVIQSRVSIYLAEVSK